MSISLNPGHRQDLANLLFDLLVAGESSMQEAIDRLLERFEVDPELATGERSNAARNNFRALIRNLNGTAKMLEVMSHIVESKLGPADTGTIGNIQDLLRPYGFTLHVIGNRVRVVPTAAGPSITQRVTDRSWLEQNGPSQAIQYLSQAAVKLGSGAWQDSMSDCRLALEALSTNGRFSDSLRELIRHGIIDESNNSTRKMDAEMLRAVYGYNSTYGSHATGGTGPDETRARLGYYQTEAAMIFLVGRIHEARQRSVILNDWC